MLKSLDILIGLSVVMLIVSMAVTLINQAILNVLARRGRCLQQGLADLLQHLDWKMPRKTAEDVAAMVLTQPSVGKTKIGPVLVTLFPSLQFGEVIHREELIKILLSFGSRNKGITDALADLDAAITGNNQSEVADSASALTCAVQCLSGIRNEVLKDVLAQLEEIGKTTNSGRQETVFNAMKGNLTTLLKPLEKVVSVLASNGIANPTQTLENVRTVSLQLEKTNPEQANDQRQTAALLQEAASPFLAKINFAFDQTMDRVSERYTYNTRVVTLISAVIVAVVLQLDTIYLFNRLSMDEKMRDAFVQEAVKIRQNPEMKKLEQNESAKPGGSVSTTQSAAPFARSGGGPAPATEGKPTPAGNPVPTPSAPVTGPAATNITAQSDRGINPDIEKQYLNFLVAQGVIRIPASWSEWSNQWQYANYLGIFLSIMLLSMGAPFWYKVIGKLLQFRSILAQKDDDQRVTRQTTQT